MKRIQVVVRVRPLNKREILDQSVSCVEVVDEREVNLNEFA
jgi:hypothetical protein